MVLGDSFPDNKKRDYVDRSLVPGMILRLFCPFTSPPKFKFILLLSMNPEPVFFIINTKPNPFVLPKFPDQQIPVIQRDYTFLTHDSYIECSTPRSDFTAEDMRAKVLADVGRINPHFSPGFVARRWRRGGIQGARPRGPEPWGTAL